MVDNAVLTLNNSIITGNETTDFGSGIALGNSSNKLYVNYCTLSNNLCAPAGGASQNGQGGAIAMWSGNNGSNNKVVVSNSTITGNTINTNGAEQGIVTDASYLGAVSGNVNLISVTGGTILTANTTWSQTASAYIVGCGGVIVNPAVTLTISPGVIIKFQPACSNAIKLAGVGSSLVANGTAAYALLGIQHSRHAFIIIMYNKKSNHLSSSTCFRYRLLFKNGNLAPASHIAETHPYLHEPKN